ncbi:hypothetical protein HII31_12503 [Pseudocercospora fuligena]|uniref:F-box domain-containing protein n=1 Tax=Pseudocercospora fuligena TaxID=685502 RepID=A0A8H6R599_9PEZI|nr:hypothetical protein HII31_12503 [Pseudocercospora fuligena]
MATAQAQPSLSAGARVANIPELLEQILLGLATKEPQDLRTLLLSQRTCHAFRDTIIGTPSLQRALTFENAPITWRTTLNPFFEDSTAQPIKLADGTSLKVTVLEFQYYNPVRMMALEEKSIRVERNIYDIEEHWATVKETRYKRTQGSWRQMRVFQEIGHPTLTILQSCGIRSKTVRGEWENPTLGEVFDLLYPPNDWERRRRLVEEGKQAW